MHNFRVFYDINSKPKFLCGKAFSLITSTLIFPLCSSCLGRLKLFLSRYYLQGKGGGVWEAFSYFLFYFNIKTYAFFLELVELFSVSLEVKFKTSVGDLSVKFLCLPFANMFYKDSATLFSQQISIKYLCYARYCPRYWASKRWFLTF